MDLEQKKAESESPSPAKRHCADPPDPPDPPVENKLHDVGETVQIQGFEIDRRLNFALAVVERLTYRLRVLNTSSVIDVPPRHVVPAVYPYVHKDEILKSVVEWEDACDAYPPPCASPVRAPK